MQPLFSKIEKRTINDVVFGLIALASLLMLRKHKQYVASGPLATSSALAVALYLCYRLFSERWSFTHYSVASNLAYADTFLAYPAVYMGLWFRSRYNRRTLTLGSVHLATDEPIRTADSDALGYQDYAATVATYINKSSFNHSFAIGVNGAWGSGKTSFINLIKERIDSDDTILIDFSSWNSTTPNAVVTDFFDTVQEAIAPYYSSLAQLLRSYSEKLISINDSDITKSIKSTITLVAGESSIKELYKQINKALSKINKRIVIFIDDLDRSDKSEILEVIRLIRNNADFYNTFFVVAYDRNYVLEALSQQNIHNHTKFLEKIFQLEINLPYYKAERLLLHLESQLAKLFPNHYDSVIKPAIKSDSYRSNTAAIHHLENIREVTRFSNSLSLNLSKLLNEVDIVDFMNIEIIRMKYPVIYELLFKKSHIFLSTKDTYVQYSKARYKLATEEKTGKYLIENYIIDNPNLSINKNDITQIIKLLSDIFTDSYINSYSSSVLSIAFPSNFRKYSTYALLEDNLSEVAFSRARASEQHVFNQSIEEWCAKGLSWEIRQRFLDIHQFDDREDFEKIITTIFNFANTPYPEHLSQVFGTLNGYDKDDLRNKISDHENRISNKYYSKDKVAYQEFIRNLFLSAKHPFRFESDFIESINSYFSDGFPLATEESHSIALGYFNQHCNVSESLTRDTWELYHNCKYKSWSRHGSTIHEEGRKTIEGSRSIFIEFIKTKVYTDFIRDITNKEHRSMDEKYTVSDIVTDIFGSWNDFKPLVHNNKDLNSFTSLFSDFYDKFVENNYKPIAYDFQGHKDS
ncbi:KAP family P-loop NTPase fold protein [Hymenobacter lapidiphilus]|uniref:KAP family P-loop NTPase fold protein n=1 Tax=Hymenobacter sp. CCM 8763 TaxID=2303334 RepID=UPI00167D15D5|nr:P-loop NTPase fold protein [Hymenobacter sp. CCM 8763]